MIAEFQPAIDPLVQYLNLVVIQLAILVKAALVYEADDRNPIAGDRGDQLVHLLSGPSWLLV